MSDIVHEGPLFTRAEGSGWNEFTGQLMETGELRLVGKDGAAFHTITIVKGSEIDGPQPNKDATKFILFLKSGKSFLEVSSSSENSANEWIAELKAFSGSKAFLGIKGGKKDERPRSKSTSNSTSGSALSAVGGAASSAAGAVGGLAAKVWRKSTKAKKEEEAPASKEKSEKSESPAKVKSEGSSPTMINVTQKSSKKTPHRRNNSGLAGSGGTSDDDSSTPVITVSNEGSRSGLVANIPLVPAIPLPLTRVKLNITPPTYKGLKFEKIEDVSDESESSDEEREEDFKILSARFHKHQSATEESESSGSAHVKRRRPRSGSVDSSDDSNDEEKKVDAPKSTASVKKTDSKAEEKKKENKDFEQRRSRIVNEVLTTEQTYVKCLAAAIQFYYDPLLAKASEIGEDQEKINRIFGNLRSIHTFNSSFLVEIQKCVQDWKSDSMFGPIFLKLAPFLKMYTAYSNKYEEGVNTFNTMLKKNEKFANLLKEQQTASGLNLGLFDLLIQPIQRVPRYSLLLKDLINHTSESHADLPNLRSAITIIEEIGQHINEEVRRAENERRLEEMSQKGVNLAALIAPHRFLLKEGLLRLEVSPSSAQILSKPDAKPKADNYQLFLFNDVLIHVKKSDVKADLDLTSAQYCCPLTLLWLAIDSGRKVLMKQPWEHIAFGDEGGWHAAIAEAVKNWCQHENENDRNRGTNDESIRYGTFDYPNSSGIYKGAFVDGRREGKGTLVTFGSSYRGEFKADKFEGKGRFDYFNGDHYLGQWSEGQMHGKGRLIRPDGSTFIGEWQRGVRRGLGRQSYGNGDFVEAKWKNDRVVDEGRMVCSNGLTYEGEMKDNRFDGVGILTLRSGSVYHGEFKDGLRHGKGILTYSDGHQYIGEFREDLRHGHGTFSQKDRGVIYEGSWELDCYHGQGTGTYAHGQYTGTWVNGERVGKGSCTYPNGGIYLGMWEDDKPHGEGIYADKSGYCYQGTWVRGKREQKGQCWFKNGGFYAGNFHNGFFNGKGGQYYGGSGDLIASYDGEFSLGRLHGKGVLGFRNGDSYKGLFHFGSIHGEGTYTFDNGTILTGQFSHQQLNGAFSAVVGDRTTLTGQVVGNVLHRVGATAFNLPASTPLLSVPYLDIDLVRILEQ